MKHTQLAVHELGLEDHSMNNRILLSSPDVTELEEKYVIKAMRSGWIAPLGPDVDAFEKEMADRIGVEHAVALSSGTAALHLALLAKGVGAGDVVITSTLTFAATANAISYTGAEPYFVDCDPTTGNMDPVLLENTLKRLINAGEQIAAIVPVDLLGKAVDYTMICHIAERYGVPVIADAAESLGASHAGRPAGSWGDASILSFNGNKIMTTSGGGMLLTNDASLADYCRYLATQARQPVAHYEHTEIGYNYRMSNLLAALGRAQLERLDGMIGRRREYREQYKSAVRTITGISVLGGDNDTEDNFWLTPILIDKSILDWTPDALRSAFLAQGIESRPLWKPMHLQPVYASHRSNLNGSSEKLFDAGITLPSGSVLTPGEIERVVAALLRFVKGH